MAPRNRQSHYSTIYDTTRCLVCNVKTQQPSYSLRRNRPETEYIMLILIESSLNLQPIEVRALMSLHGPRATSREALTHHASKSSNDVGVFHDLAVIVAHGLDELGQPDGNVDRESLLAATGPNSTAFSHQQQRQRNKQIRHNIKQKPTNNGRLEWGLGGAGAPEVVRSLTLGTFPGTILVHSVYSVSGGTLLRVERLKNLQMRAAPACKLTFRR